MASSGALTSAIHRQMHLPILLETQSFDFVPYLPDTIRPIVQIIEEVYGLDFRSPPDDIRFSGSLGEKAGQDYWPRLSEAEWIRLGQKFCIGGVIAPASWPLKLATTVDLGTVRYYRVPTELPPACTPQRS